MNPGKAASFYQSRPQMHDYLDRAGLDSGVNHDGDGQPQNLARESYGRADRLAESIRIKLLKVLTLTLLRELEGVGIETSRSTEEFDLQSEVQHFEAELIRSALIMTGGRQRRAAKLLGMKVTTLHSKIRRYGLNDVTIGEVTNGPEPSAAEAGESSPEIHVTGEN